MTKEQEDHLFDYIRRSIIDVYLYDSYLLSVNPESFDNENHVGERSIVFRFAHYLQNRLYYDPFFRSFNLDCEYNRNMDHAKHLESIRSNVYPDVILHMRGSNDNNLMVMEFKGYWSNDRIHDIEKIKAFTGSVEPYHFHIGYTILLGRELGSVIIDEYKNGNYVRSFPALSDD